jgi:MFS family permease
VTSLGKLSDIWGRRPLLLAACATFFIGSLLCAVAVNVGMLIAARAIQGVGSGGMLTLVNIVICDLFSLRSVESNSEITGGEL